MVVLKLSTQPDAGLILLEKPLVQNGIPQLSFAFGKSGTKEANQNNFCCSTASNAHPQFGWRNNAFGWLC
jgi:hypothetical protein